MVTGFKFARTPHLIFGTGCLGSLPDLVSKFKGNVLILTGKSSFVSSHPWEKLREEMKDRRITWFHEIIDHEPSPDRIDSITKKHIESNIDLVVGIGGGSVLDAGKAVSAMLEKSESVKDFLEGVGADKVHDGSKKACIAVPTTSGTGSEATKNAVLSVTGPNGFKKSLRHENLVPDYAILDPGLTLDCPQRITAASGMDAFTQLLEPYLSPKASELTDRMALQGIQHIADSLEPAYYDGDNLNARAGMSLAAYYSGVCLANAGLGVVHGFASSIGGMFTIPHGVLCGTLMGASNRVTIRKLRRLKVEWALKKYAKVGKFFSQDDRKPDTYYIDFLLEKIDYLTNEFRLPKLSEFDIDRNSIPAIVAKTACRDNPVGLKEEELVEILEERL